MTEYPIRFSLISPTFGRPEEVAEFLESVLQIEHPSFEVLLADGTPGDQLRPKIQSWLEAGRGKVRMLYKEYLPVSDARNLAAREARGSYLIFLDSDCIIPPDYLQRVEKALDGTPTDLFGGPDAADTDFTPLQKAISYSMTSLMTTGGIRGARNATTSYQPRGFNMGIRKEAFEAVNGYDESLKCGEDVDLSLRLQDKGFVSRYFEGARVYHKRRTSLKKFFRQVYRFGAARIDLAKRHKGQMKLTHLFPLGFSLFALFSIALSFLGITLPIWALATYTLAIFLHSSLIHSSVYLGALSIITTYTMFLGYGWGLWRNGWNHLLRGENIDL